MTLIAASNSSGTSLSLDTRGATLIVAVVQMGSAGSSVGVSDSQNNVWTTSFDTAFFSTHKASLSWSLLPSVSASHTVTALAGDFNAMSVAAFNGTTNGLKGSSHAGQVNQPGALDATNNLMVSAASYGLSAPDSGFISAESTQPDIAYLLGATGLVNPIWTGSAGSSDVFMIAVQVSPAIFSSDWSESRIPGVH